MRGCGIASGGAPAPRSRKRRWSCCLTRGFDNVTVSEVAAVADVAEKTVFNHFPVKAALVFDAADELLAAVRGRGAGVPAVDGIRVFVQRRAERVGLGSPPRPGPRFLQMFEVSPVLRSYCRDMFARWEVAVAEDLAADVGAPPGFEPFVAAAALVAVLRAGLEAPTPTRGHAEHNSISALDLIARGLGDYAPAPLDRPKD